MKSRILLLSIVCVAIAIISTSVAYRTGFRHGVDSERACWEIQPVTLANNHPPTIMARRVLRGEVKLRPVTGHNIVTTPNP